MTDAPERADAPPIDVLIVASWFPAYDDLAAGRFVADQAEALAVTGVASPAVISFEPAKLTGGAAARSHQESVVMASAAVTKRSAEGFVPSPGLTPSIPLIRLPIAEGRTIASGPTHAASHRRTVLQSLADQLTKGAGEGTGITHAHTAYPDGSAAITLADRLGWPLVVTEHSSFVDRLVAEPAIRQQYEAVYRRAYRILAVSAMLAAELKATFPEFADRVDVMPNAVPIDLFTLGSPDERVADQLLFVGYRKPSKGIETLLRAVAAARAIRPTITLRMLGQSPDPATEVRWRRLAGELGIAEVAAFEEARDRAGIADAMRQASIFVHPSPRETFGVVAVEALASGLPVVATDSGGVSEVLGDNPLRLGSIVPTDDPEALGRAIVATLDRRGDFDAIDLRRSVEQRYGSAFVAERLLVLFREAQATAPGGGRRVQIKKRTSAGGRSAQTIIVGLSRERASARVAALPAELRSTILLVTSSEPHAVSLPLVRRVVEVQLDTDWEPDRDAPPSTRRPGLAGRFARLAHDPIGTARRVFGFDAGSARALRPAARAIADLARGIGGDRVVEIVAIDGHDYVASAPAIHTGLADAAEGGIRRLADAWLATPPDERVS